jgi:transmembrane sensor
MVVRGRVLFWWSSGRAELSAGEAGWFPQLPEGPSAAVLEPAQPAEAHAARRTAPVPSVSTWREPAEQGDFEHAYELLARMPQPVVDNVEELLLAADTARLSGHPGAALPFLRRVISHHSQDSRAPLAAFTLGGVLMQQLGQPREAEAAYARARELSLNSSLAEDALARQVEAAHRAGDSSRARTLATEYLSRYPNGRRVHAVQRFGGVMP